MASTPFSRRDVRQPGNAADIDQQLRLRQAQLHQRQQAVPAGHDLGVFGVRAVRPPLPGCSGRRTQTWQETWLSALPPRLRAASAHRLGLFERLLAAQLAPRRQRRLDDVLVARAAAQVAVQTAPYFGFGRVRVVAQELVDRDDHARRAEAALQAVLFPERLLDRVQLAVGLGIALDRLDVGAVGLDGQDGARLDRDAVQQNRAGAALRRVAADVGAGQAKLFTDEIHQKLPRLDLAGVPRSVHGHRDGVHPRLGLRLGHRKSASHRGS